MKFRMKKSFQALGLRWSRTRERGATAIVIALTLTLVMGAAALSFDTANLALQRQTLHNITDAAAQAGASYLPGDATGALKAAGDYAHLYDTSFTPTVSLWCIVGSTGATKQVASGYIPATCNPGGSGTYVNGVGGVVCNTVLCAIPCSATATCNTVKVDGQKNVPFYFAPAIGINSGSTGAVSSVSCRGGCGTLMPNAMDIAFVADRTTSLNSTVFANMKQGIKDTLSSMTPEYQFVTLGTIHKSTSSSGCDTYLAANSSNTPANGAARTGSWTPLNFSNDYLTGTLASTSRSLNTSSTLVKNVTCMNQASQPWGTHLAAPLKAAARMLLGYQSSNLSSLSSARKSLLPQGATVKQAIIMETDGVPEESIAFNGYLVNSSNPPLYKDTNTSLGSTNLTDATDPVSGSPWNGEIGCNNLKTVAAKAKAAGITVIMIGYGDANTAKCNKNYNNGTFSGSSVDDVLAAAASPAPNGSASTANNDCSTTTGAAKENSDGDFYFCAATGAQLSGIFSTAVSQLSSTTKFVKMPGS
jgi:Putative Flp pilus-assembly TadE/G-like